MGPRPLLDLSLYLVTDAAMCDQFGLTATISAAVGAGASLVQLREVDTTDDELVKLGREVMKELRGTGVPLIVNDRIHLVGAIGAAGAHVGQSDMAVEPARALLGPTAYLGLSVQTMDHVTAAIAYPAGTLDYLGVGPVWETSSKLDAAMPAGLERLRQITSASPWPCVAIGGINLERMAQVRAAGAAGAAVISAICGQSDVSAATCELRAAWDGART